MKNLTDEDAMLIVGALDSLGVALSDEGHVWTDGERTIYEQAVAILRGQVFDCQNLN